MTRYSVGSLSTLLRQLHTVRQAGHSIDDEETAEGMQCFGAAVFALDEVRKAGIEQVSVETVSSPTGK